VTTILMLIFWIYPSPVVEAATSAAQSLF
jgi:hypothetical protein